VDAKTVFAGFILLQFLRYVVFENAFSPIYQMFFVAIPKERRGRAKTFLEGVVKPGALFFTGLYLTLMEGNEKTILMIVIMTSGAMTYLALVIRRTYVSELFPRTVSQPLQVDAVREIGSRNDLKILSLIQEYAGSSDTELRGLAVRMLSHNGSRQALGILREIYDNEAERSIGEMVAGSLGNFYWFETKSFVEELLRNDNPRVRANALSSLTEMNCRWKWEMRGAVESLLFENNLRVQIEAARFLWSSEDRYVQETIRAFLGSLLGSKNAGKRSAGLYLVGLLQPPKWEEVLLTNLRSTSLQVFTKSIEVILRHASRSTKVAALKSIEDLSRERITIAGRTAQSVGESAVDALVEYVTRAQGRRMVFEVVRALRVIKHRTGKSDPGFEQGTDTEKAILRWAYRELVRGYRDAYMWQRCRVLQRKHTELSAFVILDDALRTRVMRVAEWALDAMILLDREGVITWSRKALDLWEDAHRQDMVEILETLSESRLGSLITPIFKFDSWDDIARTGKNVFKFSRRGSGALEYFARSENRWVRVCAFYCLFQSGRLKRLLTTEPHLLENLGADSYPYIAKAARSLLAGKNSPGRIEVETFSLLETVLFLKKTPLFRTIAGEKLMGLAEICELHSYEKGTVISREGDVSDRLIIVRTGSLDIVKGKGDLRTVLSVTHVGETYGEIGLFSQSQRSASAIAHEDCELYVVQRSALKRLLLNMPDIAYSFLEIFSDRLRKTGEEVAALRAELSNPNSAAALPLKIRSL
jgi:CRP-like cAMP-binding protein/HEAT repeat protein